MEKAKDNKIVFIWKTIRYHLKHDSWSLIWATWFWTGLIPPIPPFNGLAGTYGSLAAIPLCLLALQTHWIWYLFIMLTVHKIGIDIIDKGERDLGPREDYEGNTRNRDQNEIVIDEILGMLATYFIMFSIFALPVNFWTCSAGFLLFRLFDLLKKLPGIHYWHDKQQNPLGVMMDDVVAALYAGLSGVVVYYLVIIINYLFPFF